MYHGYLTIRHVSSSTTLYPDQVGDGGMAFMIYLTSKRHIDNTNQCKRMSLKLMFSMLIEWFLNMIKLIFPIPKKGTSGWWG